MADVRTDLEVPLLLIAMPQVRDDSFHKSVVLLLHHADEGSFGLVVNRPTEMPMHELLDDMDIPWGGRGDAFAYSGGPVQPQLGTVLFGSPAGVDPAVEAARDLGTELGAERAGELLITRHVQDLSRLASAPPERFRLYLGYAGWGEGQLMEEILRNDWLTAAVDPDLLFGDDPATIWERAMRSVGVDPSVLLSWSQSGGQTTH